MGTPLGTDEHPAGDTPRDTAGDTTKDTDGDTAGDIAGYGNSGYGVLISFTQN